jgi:23S rRNA (guanosine2251-2'-O)-methyltransferase
MSEVIYGIHAIGEALKRGGRRFDYVAVSRDRTDNRLQGILDDCRAQGISVRFVPREDLDRETRTNTHQGVMAVTSRKEYTGVDELLEHKHGEYSFLLVLDGVEDPHNLGALIRSADGAGVDGVIIPERRAAGITGTVVKASAGASENLSIARVVNIARTLDELKSENVWVVGLDERGDKSYDELDYNMNCAIVMGAEGKGLHDLVRRKCDLLVSIPMMGAVSSLNVSVAGGIVMYEVQRQRRQWQKAAAQKSAGKKASAKKRKEE